MILVSFCRILNGLLDEINFFRGCSSPLKTKAIALRLYCGDFHSFNYFSFYEQMLNYLNVYFEDVIHFSISCRLHSIFPLRKLVSFFYRSLR